MSIEVIEVRNYEFDDIYEEEAAEADSFEELDKIYSTLIK
jgi:hypothetical protein